MLMPDSARMVPTAPTIPGRSWWRVTSMRPASSASIAKPSSPARCGRPWAVEPDSFRSGSASAGPTASSTSDAHGSDDGVRLTNGQPALAGDEVGINRVDALVGDSLEDAGQRGGADRRALSGRDLAGVRERQRVERTGRELTGEDRQAAAQLDVWAEASGPSRERPRARSPRTAA